MNAGKLNSRAMLATLTIRRWAATLTDNAVSEEVAKTHQVKQQRAGHYRKHAIDTKAPEYEAVMSASSELRHRHYHHTLPWAHDGARILTAVNFETYSKDMRELTAKYEAAVEAFVAAYPTLKARASVELGNLYNEGDYPTNIRSKFGVDLAFAPLPDAKDFRVALADDQVEEIRANIESELQRTTASAMREPYQRLYDHITRMVQRLSDPKGQVRESLVSGLADLCAVLPGLNLTGDPMLEELRKRSETMIQGITAEDLRDAPSVRANVAAQAQEIQSIMAGFMGPAEEEAA